MKKSDQTPEIDVIRSELERLRSRCERELSLEVWKDGRCKISCSTGFRITRCEELLELLSRLPDGATWNSIWTELFDFPESPV